MEAFADDGPHVLHLAGERDYELLRDRVHREGYRLLPFTHEFGAALAASDLALARAGGSVYELAAAGTPAVLVPYPDATGDHQAKNARHFERAGAAVVVPEREARRAPALVSSLLADSARLGAHGSGHARRGAAARRRGDRGRGARACPCLSGRRLWFVGIGGAGMSALAVVAPEPGVPRSPAGTARRRPISTQFAEVDVEISPDPPPPPRAGSRWSRPPTRPRRRPDAGRAAGGARGVTSGRSWWLVHTERRRRRR